MSPDVLAECAVRRTNANSYMVWQIIHAPTGHAVSGPAGVYPGRELLAGTPTMGDLGWRTKRDACAALSALREGSLPDRANPARDESPKAIEPDPKGRAQ